MLPTVWFEDVAKIGLLSAFAESYYSMIASYMDETFDMKYSGLFVVGGLMARGVFIFELERRWNALLKRPDIDIEYFKASQCERGKGPFRKFVKDPDNIQPKELDRLNSISCEFLSAIVRPKSDDNYIVAFGVGVVQDDFYKLTKYDADARAVLGRDPYRLAYDLAMVQCAASMKKFEGERKRGRGERDLVSFVCDESEEHSPLAAEAYINLKKHNPEAASYMAARMDIDEKVCCPLQAADAIIYELRRALQLHLGQWQGSLRRQFQILDDAGAIFALTQADEGNLQAILSKTKPGGPFSLDAIMDCTMFEKDVRLNVS
jgi:hypothetical protein